MTTRTVLGTPAPAVPWRVALGEPMALLRHSLATLLRATSGLALVGEAATGAQLVEVAATTRPDLIVADVALPGLDGLQAARRIRQQSPTTRVLLLTSDPQDGQVLAAMRDGIDGYLHKDITPHRLVEMIDSVLRGEKPVSPVLMGGLLAGLGASEETDQQDMPELTLSHRELEIMQLAAQGLSNREIALRLCISEGTVKNHVHRALQKLNMDNRIQAAAYLVRRGLGSRRVAVL